MNGRQIRQAVGKGCPNRRRDVSTVQYLLNCVPEADGGPAEELEVDGVCGEHTVAAVARFQLARTGETRGRIDPAGLDGRAMALLQDYDPLPDVPLPFSGSTRKSASSRKQRADEDRDADDREAAAPRRQETEPTAFVREVLLPGSDRGEPTIAARYARFPLEPRPSPIHRWGVFSAGAIPARRRVIEYAGEWIDKDEVWRRRLRQHMYIFWLSKRAALDGGIGGSGAEAINHSCDPNLYATVTKGRIWLVSRRPIAPGDELTLDYRLDGPDVVPCRCGSPLCRGTVNLQEA